MTTLKLNVVILAARPAGLFFVQTLLDHPDLDVVGIFTHALKPSTEDPGRGTRPEFKDYEDLAADYRRPLLRVDTWAESRRLDGLAELGPYDFLLSLSWRFLVPPSVLGSSRVAAINLHRGLLPGYEGAEPVKRMAADGLDRATITAHLMTDEYDQGRILYRLDHPLNRRPDEGLDELVTRIKTELEPLYPVAAERAINVALAEHGRDPIRPTISG